MKKIKECIYKHKIELIIIAIATILPLFFNSIIFGNSYYSKVSNDGWASFFGGYLGGIMTLIGVLLTINYQNKLTKESEKQTEERLKTQLRLDNLPVLKVETDYEDKKRGGLAIHIGCSIDDEDLDHHCINFIISNVGLKAARKVELESFLNIENLGGETIENSLFLPETTREVTIHISLPKLPSKKKIEEELLYSFRYEIIFVLYYSDLIGNHYAQYINGSVMISTHHDENGNVSYEYGILADPSSDYFVIKEDEKYTLPKERYSHIFYMKEIEKKFADFKREIEISEKKRVDEIFDKYSKLEEVIRLSNKIFKEVEFIYGDSGVCLYKKENDEIWDIVWEYVEGGRNNQKVICFVKMNVNVVKKTLRYESLEVYENSLDVSNRKKKEFERKIKCWIDKQEKVDSYNIE